LLPEFENALSQDKVGRFSVEQFAIKFSDFFMEQWKATMSESSGADMLFLIGGFDEGAPYGKVYKVAIPSNPTPEEQNAGQQFGVTWGGQLEHTNRLLKGFDPQLPLIVKNFLGLTDEQRIALEKHLEESLSSRIPYPFLPLQDCVDLSVFLIRTTMEIQNWIVGVRGVGGAIDVATITRKEGFIPVQQKAIIGQRTIIRRTGD
jgi:hypothetical protein